MPISCSVYGCNNKGEIDRLSYFTVPKDTQKYQWLRVISRDTVSSTLRVCSEHFEAEHDAKRNVTVFRTHIFIPMLDVILAELERRFSEAARYTCIMG